MTIRKLIDSDYENILIEWWQAWGWDAPKRDFLPDNGTGGLIVFDDDTPVCAGFVYVTNSSVCWVDWIISSRDYKKKPNRRVAIDLLIESLTRLCENNGAKYGYALIKNPSLIKVYENAGYQKADNYNIEMIKKWE